MNLEQTMQYIAQADDNTLFILWTSSDPVTAELMVFMYAKNSMKYRKWEHITVIIWGGAVKLTAENPQIREQIRALREMGIHFTACVTCAEELNARQILEDLNIDLVKWLDPLTAVLKQKKHLLTV